MKIFEKRLVKNIKSNFRKNGIECKVKRTRGRIFIETNQLEKACEILKYIPGIVSLSPCFHLKTSSLKKIQKFCRENYEQWIGKNETFAVRVKRTGKHKYTSQELAKAIGDVIDRKVDLKKPDREIFIEVRGSNTYIFTKTIKGVGGLPIGTAGKVISLISGGIDSPVAAWLMMKRGCKVIFVHFHSFPIVSKRSIYKVRELVKELNKYQLQSKVYFVPFSKIQMWLKANVNPRILIVLYRRFMLRIAEEIAKIENAKAIVTGESLAQVSSQTLDNLNVIGEASSLPIFRPLIGMDKVEIIDIAKKIKTYEISIKPQEDCCSLFVPKHPVTRAKLEKIKEVEKIIPIKKFVKTALKESKVEIIK
jgi:thiamine biosynthesis protein ThiI